MVVRHRTRDVRPPLARNFFQQLHKDLPPDQLAQIHAKNSELYGYIGHYWKLGFDDLSRVDFDLEECFTLLEQHEKDAERRQDYADYSRLWGIKGQLTALFAGFLDEISDNLPLGEGGLRPLARRVLDEGATVATFNYDTLLERAMIEELDGAPWDPVLAYQAPFDLFEPWDGGPYEEFRSARFPAPVHPAPFLKLHGSLNWFRIAGGGEIVEDPSGMPVQKHERLGQSLVRPVEEPAATSTTGHTFESEGTLLEQFIITPVLSKVVDERPFAQVWGRAQQEMRACSRLVVCGYSFPPSDFATRRLFLESFVGGPPDELVVINPDPNVVQQVKKLCHFKGPASVCGDLREYLTH